MGIDKPFNLMEHQQTNMVDIIRRIVEHYFIVDYGFINKINPDMTINVVHAKVPIADNGSELPETRTDNVEVLTFSGAGFSIQWALNPGDQVLLLGLKDYVPEVKKVTKSSKPTAYIHYDRATLKAIPMSVFNSSAKITIRAANGTLKIETQDKIELNGNSKQFVTWAELNQALQTLVQLYNTHGHSSEGAGPPSPSLTLDISAAKTTTILTGG